MTLLRQGVGKQDFHLPAGATLGDLLRAAEVNQTTQEILHRWQIGGRCLRLAAGNDRIDRSPARNAVRDGLWREDIGMFHDDAAFRELVEAVEKSREAEKDRS